MNNLAPQNDRLYGLLLHLAGAAVVALIVGGFYLFLDRPMQRQQLVFAERTSQIDKLMLQAGGVRKVHRQLSNKFRKMKASVDQLHKGSPNKPADIAFLEEVNRIADSTEMEILDYQLGLKKSIATHTQTEVKLQCNGSYASFCNFLEQIEHLTKTTKLSKLKLETRNNFDSYPIQMTFVLYSEVKSHDTQKKRGVL